MVRQLNMLVPDYWKENLEREARKISFETNKSISAQDLVKQAISEKFGFPVEPKLSPGRRPTKYKGEM